MVIYTAEDLTYGTMPSKDKFDSSMWNWLLHTVLIPASSESEYDGDMNYAGLFFSRFIQQISLLRLKLQEPNDIVCNNDFTLTCLHRM